MKVAPNMDIGISVSLTNYHLDGETTGPVICKDIHLFKRWVQVLVP